MKGIRVIELLATIRANIVAFLSISLFVCLGVGLFTGIQWGAVALRNAADEAYNQGNTLDIAIQFPYGLTDGDLAKLKKVDGVSEVETGYSTFVVMEDGATNYTLKMESMNKDINTPTSVTGNMPMEKDEVALLSSWAKDHGISIGDTIKLKHDANSALSDENDSDGMQYLYSDTFTVTALVENPEYLYRLSFALGVSNTASGSIDCVGYVLEDAFDASKFQDAYPNVFIRCDSLRGLPTLSDEYSNTITPIVDAITELGGELGTARYNTVHGDAQKQIDDAQATINDGERQLSEGEQKIADGEKQLAEGQQQIADGEKQLAEGQQTLNDGEKALVSSLTAGSAAQSAALTQLQDAYKQLADGQAKYDAAVQSYNTANDLYNQINAKFESVRGDYDSMMATYNSVQAHYSNLVVLQDELNAAMDAYRASGSPVDWLRVQEVYQRLNNEHHSMLQDFNSLRTLVETVSAALGLPISLGDLPDIRLTILPSDAEEVVAASQQLVDELGNELAKIDNASITVGDTTIALTNIPAGLQSVRSQLDASKQQLDASKQQLDAGWAEYNAGKAQYDAAVANGQAQLAAGQQELQAGEQTLKEKSKELEEGKKTLEEKSKELEDGKKTLEEKSGELEEGKTKFEDAKEAFDKLEKYEWVVMPRRDNGGVQSLQTVSKMMDSVKWAMASLFILVGLFVCYSAISRLVHEQIVQIGTKKALGFREGEIAIGYLAFSGLAVLIGVVLSVVLAVVVVQGIMNPTASRQFAMPAYAPYVSIVDLLLVGGLELALILLATWIAIHGMLKRNAIDLLKGESTANVKEHFYERTRLWQKMSLFSQTVVNNCVNDKRRVAGTLIGVIGCTALIVTAVTLWGNVSKSLQRHYSEVYSYDSIVYLTDESQQYADNVAMALYKRGIGSTPAFSRKLQIRKSDGTRSVVTLMVPTDEDSFEKYYHVVPMGGGKAEVENGGLWVAAAYAEHMGVKVGDELVLTEYTGKTHAFKIAGFFDYYLLRTEIVLSQMEYRQAFGIKPEPNALLVDTDGADLTRTREALMDVEGYSSLVDDKGESSYAFNELERILRTVVYIYLALSGLMAIMVLLNLNIMFVEEKKRELIVLMINGFSVRAAKAYIYRDSIVLTVIGIFFGVLLGALMGAITVFALEPENGYFIKDFNWLAAAVGVVGAGVFAAAVLIYALRRIPRFELTDINRF